MNPELPPLLVAVPLHSFRSTCCTMLQVVFPQAYEGDLHGNHLIMIQTYMGKTDGDVTPAQIARMEDPSRQSEVLVSLDRMERDANGFIVSRVGVPPSACLALFANLVGSACVHALTIVLRGDDLMLNPRLVFHTEPVTMMDAVAVAREYACLTANPCLFQQQLRNSIRAQATPELQANFAETVISMDGARWADVLSLPCGPAMRWKGDRGLTFSYTFKDLADFLAVTGGRSLNGWEIPPLGLSAKGKKRVRRKQNGYLLPVFHPPG